MGLKTDLKIGDRITMGDITITVTKNQQNVVTVDIDAPRTVEIEIDKQKSWDSNRGQQMTPAEQQKLALAKFKRRK